MQLVVMVMVMVMVMMMVMMMMMVMVMMVRGENNADTLPMAEAVGLRSVFGHQSGRGARYSPLYLITPIPRFFACLSTSL